MSHQVFICAAPRDRVSANAVRAVLEAEGIPCWAANRDLPAGADPVETARAAIAAAQVMVLIFSARANEAEDQIKRELHSAAHGQTPVLPFRVENVKPVKSLEYFLPANQFVDAFPPPLDGHLRRLAAMLKPVLDKAAPRPAMPALKPASEPVPAPSVPEASVQVMPPPEEPGPAPSVPEASVPVMPPPDEPGPTLQGPEAPVPVMPPPEEPVPEPDVAPAKAELAPLPEPVVATTVEPMPKEAPTAAEQAPAIKATMPPPPDKPDPVMDAPEPQQPAEIPAVASLPSNGSGVRKPLVIAGIAVAIITVAAGAWWFLKPSPSAQELNAWNGASQQDAIPAYQGYLATWPKGFYRDQAGTRVAALKSQAEAAFAKAKSANTSAAYESFLATYARQGVDVSDARTADAAARAQEAKAKAAFDVASSAKTRDAYKNFLADFGTSPYAADALQRLAACRTETRNTTTVKNTPLSESISGSGSSSSDACEAARTRATTQAENSCRESQGRMGKVRVISETPQNNGLQGGRILGGLFGAITGTRKESWICQMEISASCEVSTSGVHQVDICP